MNIKKAIIRLQSVRYVYTFIKHVLLFDMIGWVKRLTIKINSNSTKIYKLKDSADRNRCFIVCTGPSLKVEDVEKLSDEITFGVNGIFLMYDKTSWKPDYYICTDAPHFQDFSEGYSLNLNELSKDGLFLNEDSMNYVKSLEKSRRNDQNTMYLRFSQWNRAWHFTYPRFNPDLISGIYAFGTVTNIAITVAIYMGFKEIYIIGADCSNMNKHFVNDKSDESKSESFLNETMIAMREGYEVMSRIYGKYNVKIYNATRGGELEFFPRRNLDDVIKR